MYYLFRLLRLPVWARRRLGAATERVLWPAVMIWGVTGHGLPPYCLPVIASEAKQSRIKALVSWVASSLRSSQ